MNVDIKKAIIWCVDHNVPFCAFREPESSEIFFFSAPSLLKEERNNKEDAFFIGDFNQNFISSHFIPFELDAKATLSLKPLGSEMPLTLPLYHSTRRDKYIKDLDKLICKLNVREKAKTVISRIEYCEERFDGVLAFENLLSRPNSLFCSLCYHPQVGFWCGASPELIFEYNFVTQDFSTVALAGTLPLGQKWDEKNIEEQKIVGDYISECLSKLCVFYTKSQLETVSFGDLQHLRTTFSGKLNDCSPYEVLDALNPTPALCGYPKDRALADIAEIETSQRNCYGGIIGFRKGSILKAYVNIRCINFDHNHYCLRAGGGILANSNPTTEWIETESKIKSLLNMFLGSFPEKTI